MFFPMSPIGNEGEEGETGGESSPQRKEEGGSRGEAWSDLFEARLERWEGFGKGRRQESLQEVRVKGDGGREQSRQAAEGGGQIDET